MTAGMSRREAARLLIAMMCGAAALRTRTVYAWAPTSSAAAGPPQFEVAAIRPSSPSDGSSSGISTGHGLLHGENVTLKRCIIGAYGVGPQQVVGGPDWIGTDRWDIRAKAGTADAGDHELDLMLQSLLADRFKLVLHRDTRMMPAYVLEIAAKGPKMEKSETGESVTNTRSMSGDHPRISIEIRNTDMVMFAHVLSRSVDLPVVNQTGLQGSYNFTLSWTPDNLRAASQSHADDVTIFTAIQEQLGLRLRAAKAPVDVLVVDHAERPSEN